jgi:hypothetical protein
MLLKPRNRQLTIKQEGSTPLSAPLSHSTLRLILHSLQLAQMADKAAFKEGGKKVSIGNGMDAIVSTATFTND